jgi:hypothetical protein
MALNPENHQPITFPERLNSAIFECVQLYGQVRREDAPAGIFRQLPG